MKEMLKLGAILGIITTVSVGLLGTANEITRPIIAIQKEKNEQLAMKSILTEAETFESVDGIDTSKVMALYQGMSGDSVVGHIAKVATEGYGGTITLLIGVDVSGACVGVEILSHTETPGLGANATQETFKQQYIGKVPPLATVKGVAKDNEIVAITGATITSRAVTEAVNEAIAEVQNNQTVVSKEGE